MFGPVFTVEQTAGFRLALCVSVCAEKCVCIYVYEHCLCLMRRCSDGDFKTLLNNSLQLHSVLDACRGKSTDLALLKHI